MSGVFERGENRAHEIYEEQLKEFHAMIGEPAVANFFVTKAQIEDRQMMGEMVEPANIDLSIGKQCGMLSISRSSFYYRPKGETAMNLMLMR